MVSIHAKRILIVEDEPVLLRSILFTLKRFHFCVKGFSNGLQLLSEIISSGSEKPELIIAEIPNSVSSGIELIDKIRVAGVDTPIMAIISFNDNKLIKELKNRGVTTFLVKPFSMIDFMNQVDSCLAPE